MESEVARYLSTQIGERRAGTPEDKRAAEYIEGKMKEIGLQVSVQKFNFLGWEMTRRPVLRSRNDGEREIPSGIMLFSGSTPSGGITGEVEYLGTMYMVPRFFEFPKYAIVGKGGAHLGYLVVHTDGPVINFVLYGQGKLYGCAPYVMVGNDTHEQFQKKLAAGEKIKVSLDTAGKLVPDMETQNVIGTIPGRELPDEEIIVCAHYDSQYESKGANDNASGVDAMLRVAKNLTAGKGPKKTVRFIAFGAKEYPLYGSTYYVETLKERGLLSRVKNVINLDMVGNGEYLWAWVSHETFKQEILQTIGKSIQKKDFDIRWNYQMFPASDHYSFCAEGIPSLMFIYWPYEDYHQVTDGYDRIDVDRIEKTAAASTMIAEKLSGFE
jgi:hypothetical protein